MSQSPKQRNVDTEPFEQVPVEEEPVRICPKVEDLMKAPQTNLLCTVPGCAKIISNSAALKMHLNKTHHIYENPHEEKLFIPDKTARKKKVPTKVYCCPVENCPRGSKFKRTFATLHLVKQHYMKIHAEKNLFCRRCKKGFSTETDRTRHEKSCGVVFSCSCGCPYSTREALLTHMRRHRHSLPVQEPIQQPSSVPSAKEADRRPPTSSQSRRKPTPPSSQAPEAKKSRCARMILPKPAIQLVPVVLAVPVGMPVRTAVRSAVNTSLLQQTAANMATSMATSAACTSCSQTNQSTNQQGVSATSTTGSSTTSDASCVSHAQPAPRQKNFTRKRKHATTQTATGVKNRPSKNTQTQALKRRKSRPPKNRSVQDSGSNTNLPELSDFQFGDFQDIETQTPGDFIIRQSLMSVDIDTQTNEQLLGLSMDAYTSTHNPLISMETQTHSTVPPAMVIPDMPDSQAALSTAETQTYGTVNVFDLNMQSTVSSETQTLLTTEGAIPAGGYDVSETLHFPDVVAASNGNGANVTSTVTQTEALASAAYPGLSDSQTQTLRLLQDLNSIMASESSSTQTPESFLVEAASNGNHHHNNTVQTQTADIQEASTNSVQTETMEFDFEQLIASEENGTSCVDFAATDSDVELLDSYAQTNLRWQLFSGADNFTQTTDSGLLLDTRVADTHTQTSETRIQSVSTSAETANNTTTQTQTSLCAYTDALSSEQSDRQVQVDLQTLIKCNDSHTQTAALPTTQLTESVGQSDMQTQTFGQFLHFPPSSAELAHTETQTLFTDLGISTETNSLTDSHTQTYFKE